MRAEEYAIEEALVGGVRGVTADDVEDVFWETSGRCVGLGLEGVKEVLFGVCTGIGPKYGLGFEEVCDVFCEH